MGFGTIVLMQSHSPSPTVSAHEVASLPLEKLAKLVHDQSAEIAALRHQLEWFKRQIFGHVTDRCNGATRDRKYGAT